MTKSKILIEELTVLKKRWIGIKKHPIKRFLFVYRAEIIRNLLLVFDKHLHIFYVNQNEVYSNEEVEKSLKSFFQLIFEKDAEVVIMAFKGEQFLGLSLEGQLKKMIRFFKNPERTNLVSSKVQQIFLDELLAFQTKLSQDKRTILQPSNGPEWYGYYDRKARRFAELRAQELERVRQAVMAC